MQFRNRQEAGQLLARKLFHYSGRGDVLVLALPRGGVPVAAEVARALNVPLDVLIVRKLGVPEQEELALGAIASGGVRVLNDKIVESLGIPDALIEQIVARELRELERREQVYRDGRPPLKVRGKTIILIDDGIATGATVRAAVNALRRLEAQAIIVATPTASLATAQELRSEVDDLVAVIAPANFCGVGEWYNDFSQTTDAEVRRLLKTSSSTNPSSP